MAKRRTSEVELCFDSMTDLITNLAGGLLLLVLLLMGLTRESSAQAPQAVPQEKGPKDAAEKSVRPLLDRINRLKGEIRRADEQIRELDQRLPQLKEQVEDLLKKVSGIQVPQKAEAEKEPGKLVAKDVYYRPPLARKSDKKTRAAIVCLEGRIRLLDLEAVERAYDTNKPLLQAGQIFRRDYVIDSGDYDVRLVVDLPRITQEAIPKEGRNGESLEQFRSRESQIRSRLVSLDPKANIIQFVVYPDSYDVFRVAREEVWKLKFDIGWNPSSPGSSLIIGGGPATGQ
jgi:hypothetical protein